MSLYTRVAEFILRRSVRWYTTARRTGRGAVKYDVLAAMPGEKEPPLRAGEVIIDGPFAWEHEAWQAGENESGGESSPHATLARRG